MKKHIKSFIWGGSVMLMTLPAIVLAQTTGTPRTGAPRTGVQGYGSFNPPKDNLPGGTILGIIQNVMKWLLTAIGFIGIIGFAIAGILYLTSAGNDEQIKTAKKAMTMSIIGVIVALAGYVALRAAQNFLNAGQF